MRFVLFSYLFMSAEYLKALFYLSHFSLQSTCNRFLYIMSSRGRILIISALHSSVLPLYKPSMSVTGLISRFYYGSWSFFLFFYQYPYCIHYIDLQIRIDTIKFLLLCSEVFTFLFKFHSHMIILKNVLLSS